MDEQVLKDNAEKFMKSAELIYKTGDFTSSTILYFKSLFAILDLIIFRKIKKVPKDHTERFRILEQEFPNLYLILDKTYLIYRDTYTSIITKDICDKIRENVKRIANEHRIY